MLSQCGLITEKDLSVSYHQGLPFNKKEIIVPRNVNLEVSGTQVGLLN